MKLFIYIRKFLRISKEEKLLIVCTILLSHSINIMIKLLPLKYYCFIIKSNAKNKGVQDYQVQYFLHNIDKTFSRLLRKKFISNNCLQKSLTLKILLNLKGISNNIKISMTSPESTQFIAHSYVEIPGNRSFFKNVRFNDCFHF